MSVWWWLTYLYRETTFNYWEKTCEHRTEEKIHRKNNRTFDVHFVPPNLRDIRVYKSKRYALECPCALLHWKKLLLTLRVIKLSIIIILFTYVCTIYLSCSFDLSFKKVRSHCRVGIIFSVFSYCHVGTIQKIYFFHQGEIQRVTVLPSLTKYYLIYMIVIDVTEKIRTGHEQRVTNVA